MTRRKFLSVGSGTLASAAISKVAFANKKEEQIDASWYQRSRRFASLPIGRVAYVEHGRGKAALFLHGFPLNGYQWRGALRELHRYRRCIAPDLMGMGYSEIRDGQSISPDAQVSMLSDLLNSLHVDAVDLLANDSGGLIAQLFVARYPKRVRTLLLTNCDVDQNNPPPRFLPAVELAKKGLFADRFVFSQLNDKQLARSPKGLGGLSYTYPERLSDETIEIYFRPLVESPLRKFQLDRCVIGLGTNVLIPIRQDLRRWHGPTRMVWGLKDTFFPVEWADWLHRTLPGIPGSAPARECESLLPRGNAGRDRRGGARTMECKLTRMHSSVSSEKWTKRELHFSPTLREFWVKTRDAQTIHRAPVPLYSLTAIQEVVRSDGHVR